MISLLNIISLVYRHLRAYQETAGGLGPYTNLPVELNRFSTGDFIFDFLPRRTGNEAEALWFIVGFLVTFLFVNTCGKKSLAYVNISYQWKEVILKFNSLGFFPLLFLPLHLFTLLRVNRSNLIFLNDPTG